MSGIDRRSYLTATSLDQALLDYCAGVLECRLEAVVQIGYPGGIVRASDRNKYLVDGSGNGTFYEALLKFPKINRTLGEWLTPELEFSTLELELSNVDGRFNPYLPGGASYSPWVNRDIVAMVGLAEVANSYTTVFKGQVTEAAGAGRTVKSVKLTARDQNDKFTVKFPTTVLTKTSFPFLDDGLIGKVLPVIYGDFTVGLDPVTQAAVPAYVVNGADPEMNGEDLLDIDGVTVITPGAHTHNVQLVISENALTFFDSTQVFLKRSDKYYLFDVSDITNIGGDNRSFEVIQDATTMVDGSAFEFASGDEFVVRVKGWNLAGFDDNAVAIAQDMLMRYAGMDGSAFHSNWATFRDKATPRQSAISLIKARRWVGEPVSVMSEALGILEEVRLEAAFDRTQLFKINSLHFEDWIAVPSFTVKNWDVVKDSLTLEIDEKNNFNRAQGFYSFLPSFGESARLTRVQVNAASVTQLGKAISKKIEFPSLYVEEDVVYQLQEMVKLASSLYEVASVELTWRALLLDLGDFVGVNVAIGSTVLSGVPGMVRSIGYDPEGFKLPIKFWLFAMCPFPGYTPGYGGTVGGSTATITEE